MTDRARFGIGVIHLIHELAANLPHLQSGVAEALAGNAFLSKRWRRSAHSTWIATGESAIRRVTLASA